jgi:hypothetical protein
MGHLDRPFAKSTTLRQEMESALVGTALRFGDAVHRFEQRRRRCGFDHSCHRLIDEVSLSRSMLLLLAEEVSRAGPGAQRGHQ